MLRLSHSKSQSFLQKFLVKLFFKKLEPKPFKGEPLSICMICPDQHTLAKCSFTGARPAMCLCSENSAGAAEEQKKVEVTPPGDIRPAFDYDIRRINSVSEKQFSAPLIPEAPCVLNKAPYEDRMDEIIVDGEVLASIRFEIESCEWVLLPRLEGARRLFQGRDKKKT